MEMYTFLILEDGTEIKHSGLLQNDQGNGLAKEVVKVRFERAADGTLCSASCALPDYIWEERENVSEDDIDHWNNILHLSAHLMISCARSETNKH